MHAIASRCSCERFWTRPYERQTAKDRFFFVLNIIRRDLRTNFFHTSSVQQENVSITLCRYRVQTISKDELFVSRITKCIRFALNTQSCIIVTETAISMAIEIKLLTAHFSFFFYLLKWDFVFFLAWIWLVTTNRTKYDSGLCVDRRMNGILMIWFMDIENLIRKMEKKNSFQFVMHDDVILLESNLKMVKQQFEIKKMQ